MAGTQPAADPGGAAPPPAPAISGQDVSPKFTVTDTRSAGDAIAGLLFGASDEDAPPAPGGDQQPSGGEEPPDTGAQEPAPTGEEDDKGQGEQPEKPAAIEPPVSWNAEEKQAFSQLPPALQQAVVRRESQREAALTQRSQEAAEWSRTAGAEREAAVAQRQEYLAGLQKMLVLAAPEAAAFDQVDWLTLSQTNQAEYTRLQGLRDHMRARLGAIEGQFQAQAQQADALRQQQLAEHVGREVVKLNESWPDFGDEARGPTLRKELSTYLSNGGFSNEELGQAYDHRLVVLATKAMLYDRQQSLSAAADAKRNNAVPQVRAPGVSQESGDRGPNARLRTNAQRLGRTHSVRDAGSLIADLL
jgi:hypothetical protein